MDIIYKNNIIIGHINNKIFEYFGIEKKKLMYNLIKGWVFKILFIGIMVKDIN